MIATVVFLVSAAFVIYVTAAYPVIVWWIARHRARPVKKVPVLKTVSVLIAVHNGEKFLRDKIRSVLALDYPRDLMEIFILCDGCTDATEQIANEFLEVQTIRLPRCGKPAALNQGIWRARNEILFLTDVRQPLAPDSLRHLVANFADPTVGAVSGDLIILAGDTQEEADVGFYWRTETWIRRKLSAIDSMFGATGPFYAMRRELAVPIPPDILLDDMYLPLAAFFKGYRLVVDSEARAFDFPTSLNTEFRRKVRTLAGNYQLFRYYPQLLTKENRLRFLYLSQKLGRLLLPYAMVVLAISSLFLPDRWSTIAVGTQIGFYLLAVLDRFIPQGAAVKRISSPVRTFIVMLAAGVCAVSIFFVAPQRLWKVTTNVGIGKGAA